VVLAAQLASRLRASWVRVPGSGGVGDEAIAEVGGQGQVLEREVGVADDWVVKELNAGGVDLDVVRCPSAPELLAAGGQLPDQVG
jgi:hypothetical protein